MNLQVLGTQMGLRGQEILDVLGRRVEDFTTGRHLDCGIFFFFFFLYGRVIDVMMMMKE